MTNLEGETMQTLEERIQGHITGATVTEARHLGIFDLIGEGEAQVHVFAYRTDACDYEMRGAFTNGDPVWEEDDPEAFARMIGEAD